MKHLYLGIFLFCFVFLTHINGFSQTSTISLNTSQSFGIGAFGDVFYKSLTIKCTGFSASSYTWTVNGYWQYSNGSSGTLKTSSSSITIVPIPGFESCGTATISVTGPTTGGGGQNSTVKTNNNPGIIPELAASYPTYTLSLNRIPWSISSVFNMYSIPSNWQVTVSGVSSKVSWTWKVISNGLPQAFISLDPSSGNVGVFDLGSVGSYGTYTALVGAAITGGSPSCPSIIDYKIVYTPAVVVGGLGCYVVSTDGVDLTDLGISWSYNNEFCTYTPPAPGKTSNVKIYPNPSVNELSIELTDQNHYSVMLYNQRGDLVGVKENVTDKIKWDTSTLSEGIYYVIINDGAISTTERFMVKK